MALNYSIEQGNPFALLFQLTRFSALLHEVFATAWLLNCIHPHPDLDSPGNFGLIRSWKLSKYLEGQLLRNTRGKTLRQAISHLFDKHPSPGRCRQKSSLTFRQAHTQHYFNPPPIHCICSPPPPHIYPFSFQATFCAYFRKKAHLNKVLWNNVCRCYLNPTTSLSCSLTSFF